MGMRLDAALTGDLRALLQAEADAIRTAEKQALRTVAKTSLQKVRAATKTAGLGKLAKRWRSAVYTRKSGTTVAVLYGKGERSRQIIAAFEEGATIRPTTGKYLAIPTQWNRKGGRRNGKALYQPNEIQGAFVRRNDAGHLLMFAPIQAASRRVKGKVRSQAYVNSHLLGSGRVKRTAEIMKYGAVPMFTLVEQIRISKKTNIQGMASKFADDLMEEFIRELNDGDS